MGWDIYIGETVIEVPDADSAEYHVTVKRIELDAAPCWPNPPNGWGDISGKSNHRAPQYSGLASFVRSTGISVPAFSASGSDGRCYILRPVDLQSVREARRVWEAAHPTSRPGWCNGDDPTLAKLIWYEWWFDWALNNCERPAIQMS